MSRVVVVGGGGTGIGRSIAQSFALDGEQVVIVGRRLDTLAGAATEIGDKAGAPVETISADLADPGQVDQLRQWVAERYGRVDVLVNAAGGNVDIGAKPPEIRGSARVAWSWQGNFRANVLTAVLLTEALRDLLASPGGRVVLISSIAAYRGSGTGSYAASKAALHPYAYDLAAALGSRDVTVNTVAPGYIEGTEFFGRGRRDQGQASRHTRRCRRRRAMAGIAGGPARDRADHPGERRRRTRSLTPFTDFSRTRRGR